MPDHKMNMAGVFLVEGAIVSSFFPNWAIESFEKSVHGSSK